MFEVTLEIILVIKILLDYQKNFHITQEFA